MAQRYHNIIDVLGTSEQRRRFVADAISQSPARDWDWVALGINSEAARGGDSGKTRLDFYSRGFPEGLNQLMERHPDVTLECDFRDLSLPARTKMQLRNNLILAESSYAGEEEGWVQPADHNEEHPSHRGEGEETI